MKHTHKKHKQLKKWKPTLRDKRRLHKRDLYPMEAEDERLINIHSTTHHLIQPNKESGYYRKSKF